MLNTSLYYRVNEKRRSSYLIYIRERACLHHLNFNAGYTRGDQELSIRNGLITTEGCVNFWNFDYRVVVVSVHKGQLEKFFSQTRAYLDDTSLERADCYAPHG